MPTHDYPYKNLVFEVAVLRRRIRRRVRGAGTKANHAADKSVAGTSAEARGAADGIKPGVERSETPGTDR